MSNECSIGLPVIRVAGCSSEHCGACASWGSDVTSVSSSCESGLGARNMVGFAVSSYSEGMANLDVSRFVVKLLVFLIIIIVPVRV
jgi:hypothetical protein